MEYKGWWMEWIVNECVRGAMYFPESTTQTIKQPQSAVLHTTGFSLATTYPRTRRLSEAVVRMGAIEFLAVGLSAYVASFAYHYVGANSSPPASQYGSAAVFIALMVLLFSISFRHFEAIQTQPRHRFLWSGIGAVGLAFSVLLSSLFLFKISEDYSRGSFIFQVLSVSITVICTRAISYSRLQSAIAAGLLAARRVVLIGDDALCSHFAHRLKATGILAIGSFRFPSGDDLMQNDNGLKTSPSVAAMLDLCRNSHPDEVIILANQENFSTIPCLTRKLSELPMNVHIVPRDSMDLFATSRIAEFGNVITFQVSSAPLSSLDLCVKRTFDIIAAIAGLVLFSPLFLCAAVAIKLDSTGPVFFRQIRHGYNKQAIGVFKFRTMTTLENGSDFKQVRRNDNRVTPVGRILRRSNIDELPQLINVLMGEMSIVGPRPHATAHNDMFEDRILPFARRHNVKPGITGWAQVNGARGETDTLEKMQERVEYDLYYIDNWSFLFDVKIIVMTLFSKSAYLNAC
jgi:Undecaprenyl-phosphate glucose phosphotransferase